MIILELSSRSLFFDPRIRRDKPPKTGMHPRFREGKLFAIMR